jgi:hypothetical protein
VRHPGSRQLQLIEYFADQEGVSFGRKEMLPSIFLARNAPWTSEVTFDGMRANGAESKVRDMSPDIQRPNQFVYSGVPDRQQAQIFVKIEIT